MYPRSKSGLITFDPAIRSHHWYARYQGYPLQFTIDHIQEVGLNLFKSSSMKLNEMKTLAHATWEHLTDVSEVNTSHLSVGLGLLITFVSVACCMICCQCSLFDIPKWCKAKREGHTTDWSSVKFWKKKTSSNATDDVELESVDSKEVRILDSALGTKFMEKLDKLSQDCDHENLKTLMESELKPSEIDKCFKLGISTAGGRYKRDMNLINMGAGGGDDAQMTDQINKNFKLLSRNEKELFRRLVSLGVEKDLETEILEDHSQNLKLFDNRLRGLEQSSNILTYHRDFLQHILQASNHSFQLMDKLFQRIKNMERYISLVLEARDTVCIDLTCFDSKGIHLSVNSQGLALFIKGNMLSAQAGVTPSCSMNSRQEISIHHMKHMSVLNSTHLQDGDYKVKIECLSDYALCSKEENIRHINKNDLIEGNLLLSPWQKP